MPSQFMLTKLAASGLDPADVDATDVLDFNNNPCGFKLPYYRSNGTFHPLMHRVRVEKPAPGQGKYTQPSSAELVRAGHPTTDATHPYLNPHILGGLTWDGIAAHPAPKRILIVEGEIKAAAAGKMLLVAAIGIPGCWGGVVKDAKLIYGIHPLIRVFIRPGDLVEVVLDGDVLTNPDVNRAAGTLKRALERLGVRPVFVLLPPPPPGRGLGLDDWLMDQPDGTRQQAFAALPRTDGEGFDEDWLSAANAFGLAVNAKGTPLPTPSNLQIIMEKHARYKDRYYYDVMRGNLYRNEPSGPRAFVDSFGFDEQVWLNRKFGMAVSKPAALDALRWMAEQPRWRKNLLLNAIPPWDNTPRLEEMFIHGWGAKDTDYIRAVGANWLVSAMARANEPGCKVDTMLVLMGPQGTKKTKSLEAIAGSLYVATHAQVQDKDFILSLHRGWIIDLAELSSMSHSDNNHVKGIITNAIDHIRPPYGSAIVEMPRHSVMVGTTNDERFLRDATGNRRYWPVECGDIDVDWVKANRMQLLAEAQHQYMLRQDWWVMPASTAQIQAAHLEIGPWDAPLELILSGMQHFPIITVNSVSFYFITSEGLLDKLGIEIRFRKSHMYRDLAASMKRIAGRKWEKYFCSQRIVHSGGGYLDGANGYRTPVTGNPLATVVNMPARAPLY